MNPCPALAEVPGIYIFPYIDRTYLVLGSAFRVLTYRTTFLGGVRVITGPTISYSQNIPAPMGLLGLY